MTKNDSHTEEAQIALISKMRLHSNPILSQSERELCDLLIHDLYEKIKQRNQDKRAGAGKSADNHISGHKMTEAEETIYRAKMEALRNQSAQELVTTFVEAWNTGDFELEYCCLANDFTRGGRRNETISEYNQKRQKKYRERHRSGCLKKVVNNCRLIRTMGGDATVECTETHVFGEYESTIRRQYTLVHEEGCWRVFDFKNLTREENSAISSE